MRQRYVVELPDFSVELVVHRDDDARLNRDQARLVESMFELAPDELVADPDAEDDEPERGPSSMPPESAAPPLVDETLVRVVEQAARAHQRRDPDEDLRPPVTDEEDSCDCTVLPRDGRYVIGIHHARGCQMWHGGDEPLPPEPEGRGSKAILWAPPEDAPAKPTVDDDSFPA